MRKLVCRKMDNIFRKHYKFFSNDLIHSRSKNKITGMGGAFSVNIAKYCSNDKYAIDIKGEKKI